MILYPNCKINLGLHILERRQDGYHNIETVMYPVTNLRDSIELLPAPEDSLTTSGFAIDCPDNDNICMKVVRLMRSRYDIAPVAVHLHKAIPFGAGLGGGSADASFLIRGLNELFGLCLSVETLCSLASELGSDTPFFIRNTPALCTGRGEVMTPIELDLSQYRIEIVKPDVNVSTAEAYRGVKPDASRKPLSEIVSGDISTWRDCLINDFEASVAVAHPEIEELKEDMYRAGAIYAAMSGSGSAVFGIF